MRAQHLKFDNNYCNYGNYGFWAVQGRIGNSNHLSFMTKSLLLAFGTAFLTIQAGFAAPPPDATPNRELYQQDWLWNSIEKAKAEVREQKMSAKATFETERNLAITLPLRPSKDMGMLSVQ